MDQKNTGIIATIAAALLCGCPGLFAVCWGALAAVISFIPNADIDIGGSSDPTTALIAGIGTLCIGVIFIIIPIAVGFFTLRKKPQPVVTNNFNEPLPPTS